MDTHELLVRHARTWAESKHRTLDGKVLEEALSLRLTNDELSLDLWPEGSAERLMLVTWPAYGPEPEDPELIRDTLDTFWGFLRATGRMNARSASPAALRKEARRAAPKMREAYDDPRRHSQGRVFNDFAESIGLNLEGAETVEELQERLDEVQERWNELPQEERFRLMPDPSPKSLRGERWTTMASSPETRDGHPPTELLEILDLLDNADDEDQDLAALEVIGGDPEVAAQDARKSTFLQACLSLAAWVGDRREVTSIGVLRPAVAREAYQALDLWTWEREFQQVQRRQLGLPASQEQGPEVEAHLARVALNSWTSAGDCLALDRLWYGCEGLGLVEVGATVARSSGMTPEHDEEWRALAAGLFLSLCMRLGDYAVEPLVGVLLTPMVTDQPVPLGVIREWWETRQPKPLRNVPAMHWDERLDTALFHFSDHNLWRIRDDEIELTDLGREVALALTAAMESGLLAET